MNNWQTKETLTALLCSLVQHQSITGSKAEKELPLYLHHILAQKPYFKRQPGLLKLHALDDGRKLITALVKNGETDDTIILLSHYDVVGISDYGSLEHLACHPRELTKQLLSQMDRLPEQVQQDLAAGEWLFGRGTMDMKAGIALHLCMLEKAMDGEFNGNILFLSVPDEEVNSKGMKAALPVLSQLKIEEQLTYKVCLNGEPILSKYPGDTAYYIYTGSIGKVLPGFLCVGKSTHVGEPFAGINPNLMLSFIANEMELNEAFVETNGDNITPPPVSLMHRDLKEKYSVQTPNMAVTMYNILYLQQTIPEITDKLFAGAQTAMYNMQQFIQRKSSHFKMHTSDFKLNENSVRIMLYDELYREAVNRFGDTELENHLDTLTRQHMGERDLTVSIVQELARICSDLGSMVILFYSPPFYPAVTSHQDPYIITAVKNIKKQARKDHAIDLSVLAYFTGLSDLSYIGEASSHNSREQLYANMPLADDKWLSMNDERNALTMPVLNIGPFGRDAHQWTERLELTYTFDVLPDIIANAINQLLKDV